MREELIINEQYAIKKRMSAIEIKSIIDKKFLYRDVMKAIWDSIEQQLEDYDGSLNLALHISYKLTDDIFINE